MQRRKFWEGQFTVNHLPGFCTIKIGSFFIVQKKFHRKWQSGYSPVTSCGSGEVTQSVTNSLLTTGLTHVWLFIYEMGSLI